LNEVVAIDHSNIELERF